MIIDVNREFIKAYEALIVDFPQLKLFNGNEDKYFVWNPTSEVLEWIGKEPDKFPYVSMYIGSKVLRGLNRVSVYNVLLMYVCQTSSNKAGVQEDIEFGERIIERILREFRTCKVLNVGDANVMFNTLVGSYNTTEVIADMDVTLSVTR